MKQRNLSKADVLYVLLLGRKLYNAGVLLVFLGKRDIPQQDLCDASIARLEGTAVLVDVTTSVIVTVYRSKEAFKKHRKKAKYNQQPHIA